MHFICIFANSGYKWGGMQRESLARSAASRAALWLGGAGFACAALACGGAPADLVSNEAGGAGGSAGASVAGGGSGGAPVVHNPLCVAPPGVSNDPQSIAETLTLLNALPKPLTIPCFLESLARPLQFNATKGTLSAQPAVGARSPRIFLFLGPNTMSVAPEGDGAFVLEFGEKRENLRSLKGELLFPLAAEVPPSAPFERVHFNDTITTCGLCHSSEVQDPTIGSARAFVSTSYRPLPENRVLADSLLHEQQICDHGAEPYRCQMLDALFAWGTVNDAEFPNAMATFQ